MDGGQIVTITGAASRVQVDVDYYDGSTFSKIVDASILGNPHTLLRERANSVAGGADGAVTSYEATVYSDTSFKVADADLIPGATKKTRTLFQFWSAASGAGNLVAELWADEVRSWSTTKPENLF